jgi:hypothetical protein
MSEDRQNLRVLSKEPQSKLRGSFKPTPNHHACPFVRDLQEPPAKSFPGSK